MIITRVIGLYTFDKNGIKEITSPDIEEINKQEIIGSLKLNDGNIALNTASNGVIIINDRGIIISKINMSSGIADNDIKQIYQDKYDNLWLATNNGISFINYSSPISLFLNNDKSASYGSVKDLMIAQNKLFVGTTTGLFQYSLNKKQTFEPIEGLSKNITALYVADGSLFVGTSEAAYLIQNSVIRKVASISVSTFLYSSENTRLYIIGKNGIVVLQKKI
jgi:ligand-binding sensor domain-containing protein